MSRTISFATKDLESLVPDNVPKDELEDGDQEKSNCPSVHGIDKTNYETINSITSNQIALEYLTLSSTNSYHRDTAVLLYQEHQAFNKSLEERLRRKSRNATICFILVIIIVIVLIVIAVISFHKKVTMSENTGISDTGNASPPSNVNPYNVINSSGDRNITYYNTTAGQ